MIKILKKKIKLGIFILLFIIISPLLVMYASGDILGGSWSLLKTGGIYINSAPINSEVYIDSKLKDNTSFFERNILIKNLKPGFYDIVIKKEGYNIWSKKITVLNNLVSDANVFMLQEKIESKDIPKENIIDSKKGTTTVKITEPNEQYLYLVGLFSEKQNIDLKNKNIATSTFSNTNRGTKESPIMNGKIGLWKEEKQVFVSWYGRMEIAPKYFCNNDICVETIEFFDFENEPLKVDFLPGYDDVVLVASGEEIFAVQIEDNPFKQKQLIYKGAKPNFRIVNDTLYVKDGDTIVEILL